MTTEHGLFILYAGTGTGILLVLFLSGISFVLRAERSGKKRKVKEEVGSIFDDDAKVFAITHDSPRIKKKR